MQFNVHVPRGLDEIKNKTAIARQELQIMNKVIQDGAGQLINWGKNTLKIAYTTGKIKEITL